MPPTLSDQARRAAIELVKRETPQSFTVGGHFDGQTIVGGLTYDRTWSNGLGLTAYIKAWWGDLPVSTHARKSKVEVGGQVVKQF